MPATEDQACLRPMRCICASWTTSLRQTSTLQRGKDASISDFVTLSARNFVGRSVKSEPIGSSESVIAKQTTASRSNHDILHRLLVPICRCRPMYSRDAAQRRCSQVRALSRRSCRIDGVERRKSTPTVSLLSAGNWGGDLMQPRRSG